MRIADIIRIHDKDLPDKKGFPPAPPEEAGKEEGLKLRRLKEQEEISLDEKRSIDELYQRYLTEIRSIFKRASADFRALPDKETVQGLSRELVDKLLLCHIDMVNLLTRPGEDEYLYSHTVNVTFLSVLMGVWLNYNKSDLTQLATAAAFHDIGMVKVLRLALLPRRLDSSERKEVEEHPNYSRDFVSRIPEIDHKVIAAVQNHHRRLGLSTGDIDEYSQIIGLVDTFEAITHPRAYKKPLEPHSAIRKIIDELKERFDSGIIKALIDNIGIYPVGTWVRLDTEEIGLVIDINSGFSLSPKVNILFSKEGELLSGPRTVDLSRQKNIHIKSPLEKEMEHRLKETFLCLIK